MYIYIYTNYVYLHTRIRNPPVSTTNVSSRVVHLYIKYILVCVCVYIYTYILDVRNDETLDPEKKKTKGKITISGSY